MIPGLCRTPRRVSAIRSTERAFAAVLASGKVVTWGEADHGGESLGRPGFLCLLLLVEGSARTPRVLSFI